MTAGPGSATRARLPASRPGRRRKVRVVVCLLLVGALAWLAWSVVEVRSVATQLRAADDAQRQVRADVSVRDVDGAQEHLDLLSGHATSAATSARSLPLRLASTLPVVGDDVRAVQTTTAGLEVVTRDVLPALVDAAEALDPESLTAGGTLDLAAVSQQAPATRAAADVSDRQRDLVLEVDPGVLLPPLREPVRRAQDGLAELAETTGLLADATEHVPAMLGADEPREYVLVVQNLAESRPTGGVIGAWAQLEIDAGVPRLVETGTEDDLLRLAAPATDVPDDVLALYGQDLALAQNVNLSPDFPLAARLVSGLWQAQGRPAPDGVIAVDPVVLAQVMTITGPVAVPGGPQLDDGNVVQWLLRDVYASLGGDSDVRRSYLGTVTGAVFDELSTSPGRLFTAGRAVMGSDAADHVRIWAAASPEQELVVRAGIAGDLPAPAVTTVGVYLTNADGSKLDYWSSTSVRVTRDCSTERLALEVDLSNGAPAEVPAYMANQLGTTGNDLVDLPPGAVSSATSHVVVASVFLPPERGVSELAIDDVPTAFSTGTESGWTVVRVPVTIDRGTTARLQLQLSGSTTSPDTVRTQPAVLPVQVDARVPSC